MNAKSKGKNMAGQMRFDIATSGHLDMDVKNEKLISIIIPTCNRAVLLVEAIESVLSQTSSKYELIVVDDGSTDETHQIVKRYAHQLRYIRKRKTGAPDTRNHGIHEAIGEYVLWLDDDDILCKGALQSYQTLIGRHPEADVVYGMIEEFDHHSGETIKVFDPADWSENVDSLLCNLVKGCVIPNPGTIVKRSAYEKIGAYNQEFPRAHDYEFWGRAAVKLDFKKNYSIVCRHRNHEGNLSSGTLIDRSYESLIVRSIVARYGINNIYPFLQSEKKDHNQIVANYYVATNLYRLGDMHNCHDFLDRIPENEWEENIISLKFNCCLCQERWVECEQILDELKKKDLPDSARITQLEHSRDTYRCMTHAMVQAFQEKNPTKIKAILNEMDAQTFMLPASVLKEMAAQAYESGNIELASKLCKGIVMTDPTNDPLIDTISKLIRIEHLDDAMLQVRRRIFQRCDYNIADDKVKQIQPMKAPHIAEDIPSEIDDPMRHSGAESFFFNCERKESPSMQYAGNFQKGVECLIDGGYTEVARWLLEKFIAEHPRDGQAHHERGMLAHGQGATYSACQDLQKAAALSPGDAAIQKSLADFYYVVQGRTEQAVAQYQKVLDLYPNDVETLLITAHLCVCLHCYDQAGHLYERVLSIDPGHAEAREISNKLTARLKPKVSMSPDTIYQDACLQVKAGKAMQAVRSLEALISDFPDFAPAYNDLAVLYYEAGDKQKAQSHYERSAELDSGNINSLKNLADFYYVELGDIQKALERYVQAMKLDPQDPECLFGAGHICMALKHTEDARFFFNRLLEIDPLHEQARNLLLKLEQSAASVDLYQSAQGKAAAGDLDGAIFTLQQLIAQKPNHGLAYNDLGVLFFEKGNREQALRHYETAFRMDPKNTMTMKNLADFYFVEQGRIQDALKLYVNVLELDREDADALCAAGTICLSLERKDDARTFFERVMEIDPLNALAQQSLDYIGKDVRCFTNSAFVFPQ